MEKLNIIIGEEKKMSEINPILADNMYAFLPGSLAYKASNYDYYKTSKFYGIMITDELPTLAGDGLICISPTKHDISIAFSNKWYDSQGMPKNNSGTTSERPTNVKAGFLYKDTTLNKWCISNGDGTWEVVNGVVSESQASDNGSVDTGKDMV